MDIFVPPVILTVIIIRVYINLINKHKFTFRRGSGVDTPNSTPKKHKRHIKSIEDSMCLV